MGGNALKNCTTRRFQAEEYYTLEHEVLEMLSDVFIISRIKPILAYRYKESMGDMDVLVESDCIPNNWMDLLKKKFQPKETLKNGNVFSFEYKECQIDLVLTKKEEFESSYQYFNYNDLGNLCGRVAHSMGLKLGHDGLTYKFFGANERHLFKELKLLDDWKDILPVLGYSYERYEQGFYTLENIFEFVVSSPFFNKSIYALENRNHAARIRDKKRKTYMEFLTWLEGYEETGEQKFVGGAVKFEHNKSDWLQYLFGVIPSFKEQYDATVKECAQAQEYKKRFNGDLVSAWTGLEKQELGRFMAWLKSYKNQERWKKDIVTLNPVLVEGLVVYYFEMWKKLAEV